MKLVRRKVYAETSGGFIFRLSPVTFAQGQLVSRLVFCSLLACKGDSTNASSAKFRFIC